jgi:hypothetical protein
MVASIAIGVGLGAAPVRGVEQRIVPLTPPEEQRVEQIGAPDDLAQVQAIEHVADQDVAPAEPPSAAAKAASTAGKVALSVAVAGVSVAAMAASLLFL